MALIQAGPAHMRIVRRPIYSPINGTTHAARRGRLVLDRSRRPGPSRPANISLCYRGSGVEMSTAPHRRRRATAVTTVGLALLAGGITLWLGLVAHFGSMINGDLAGSSARVPDRLAVVRVEPGESLQDVAVRVAPDSPPRKVIERIRELNVLDSTTLAAGRTLIAPVG